MFHSKFAPRLLAMGLLAASALSVTALAAPTAIRVDGTTTLLAPAKPAPAPTTPSP